MLQWADLGLMKLNCEGFLFGSYISWHFFCSTVSLLPYRTESTFPQLASTSPTVLTGWLNLLPFPYEPETYHVAQTQCVFATLDLVDATLTLRRPAKSNAVPKRAMPKEKVPSPPAATEETPAASEEDGVSFTDTRRYRLAGAQVELSPSGLVSKRMFSKKYPIAVTFPEEEEEDKEANKKDKDGDNLADGEDDETELRHRKRDIKVRSFVPCPMIA